IKQIVHSLIEEEMAAFDPPDYLVGKPAPRLRFASKLLKEEWDRVSAGIPMKVIDTSRYELQQPQGPMAEDEEAWKGAVDNARAQIEHQQNRLLNLELLQNYGASLWLRHNKAAEEMEGVLVNQVKRAREEAEGINAQRKVTQEGVQRTLWNLARARSDGADKNLKIELACQQLRVSVKRLKAEAAVR
ncbi:unnamed protein product, partial [Choristocarpus tenellus]